MILGQILTNNKNINTNEFIKVVNDKSELKTDLPTLIVGKSNAKDIIGWDKMSYLNKKVNDKLYWTFGKTEKRDEYEKDLKRFSDAVINNLLKNITYKYINLFFTSLTEIKLLILIIKNNKKKTYFIFEDIIYLYYENVVYGISLIELDYLNIDRKKVLKLFNENKNNKLVKSQYSISKNMRKTLKNSIFLIPYIYFLEKKDVF